MTDTATTASMNLDPEVLQDLTGGAGLACECMLCDFPDGHTEMEVRWRLIFDFNRLPAVEHGQDVMLLCDHCLNDWINNPDDFGGDVVRFHPI